MHKLTAIFLVIILSACSNFNQTSSYQCDCESGDAITGTKTAVVKVLMVNGKPKVDTETVELEVGERIVWVGPTEMTIRFPDGTPFREKSLTTKDSVISRIIPEQKERVKKYKYDVLVGDEVLDPIMIIRGRQ